MRRTAIVFSVLLAEVCTAETRVSVGFSQPGISIGINFSEFPELQLVPGSPVYYSPRGNTNYFFYDGEYWVYRGDRWYASDWYNGPWDVAEPEYVPIYVLRVPVRYYRAPPQYFFGWRQDAPPRWGDHWGRHWERGRAGWDHWDRHSVPAPAPLPRYQRQYSGDRYPRSAAQRESIRAEHYNYQPREATTQQHFQQRAAAADTRVTAPQRQHEQQPHSERQNTSPPRQYPDEAYGQRGDRATQPQAHSRSNAQNGRQDKQRPVQGQHDRQQQPQVQRQPHEQPQVQPDPGPRAKADRQDGAHGNPASTATAEGAPRQAHGNNENARTLKPPHQAGDSKQEDHKGR